MRSRMRWMLLFWMSTRSGCALSLALTSVSAGLTLYAVARRGPESIAAALARLTMGLGATT
jgi:VIT1/CCC1 family predicted Fe2+/Mn2+ transporter